MINLWNEVVDMLHLPGLERPVFVENNPENPNINYHQNPLKALEQLMGLIDECRRTLSDVYYPALVIQSEKDPVVHPSSGQIIYDLLAGGDKTLERFPSERHGIVRGEGREAVFEIIRGFIERVAAYDIPRHRS